MIGRLSASDTFLLIPCIKIKPPSGIACIEFSDTFCITWLICPTSTLTDQRSSGKENSHLQEEPLKANSVESFMMSRIDAGCNNGAPPLEKVSNWLVKSLALKEAFSALLQDNDYQIEPDHPEVDLYATLNTRGFFIMIATACDDKAVDKAQQLIDLRKKYKHKHDYGLVVPAFQEHSGILLTDQEAWIAAHVDILSTHRIGIYGVDNADPNRIYPFTIYPQVHGLLRYFVAASRQWQDVRTQYLLSRGG